MMTNVIEVLIALALVVYIVKGVQGIVVRSKNPFKMLNDEKYKVELYKFIDEYMSKIKEITERTFDL